MAGRRMDAVIVVSDEVVATLARLATALPSDPGLVGGWAVACRLRMARSDNRTTGDVDALLAEVDVRTTEALQAIGVVQDDPTHSCRITGPGLSVVVDLLTQPPLPIVGRGVPLSSSGGEVVTVGDLNLLIPPFAALMARTAVTVQLEGAATAERVRVGLPAAGAIFAGKVANVALDHRLPPKRGADGEDAVRLAATFGALALLDDVSSATAEERAHLARLLDAIGASGLSAQARVVGHHHDEGRVAAVVDDVLAALR